MGNGRGNGVLAGGICEISEERSVSLLGFEKEWGRPGGECMMGGAIVEDVRRNEVVEGWLGTGFVDGKG